jgi:membrane protease YdiL (CAAX protease family)
LLWFFSLAFSITWGLALLLLVFPAQMTRLFGPLSSRSPVFWLAVFSPSLSALIVTGFSEGRAGLGRLLARQAQWRFGWAYYAFILIGLPLLGVLAAKIAGNALSVTLAAAAAWVASDPGPLGEELGWRGFALPRLLERHSPLRASLILGAVWGVWHLPAFLFSGLSQGALALPSFLLGAAAVTVIGTWLYLGSRGSVLAASLLHLSVNLSQNVIARTFDVWVVLLVLAAAAVSVQLVRHRPILPAGAQPPETSRLTP